MDLASWSLGLSLIVLTIAIHTTGVVLMAFVLWRPQLRLPLRAVADLTFLTSDAEPDVIIRWCVTGAAFTRLSLSVHRSGRRGRRGVSAYGP